MHGKLGPAAGARLQDGQGGQGDGGAVLLSGARWGGGRVGGTGAIRRDACMHASAAQAALPLPSHIPTRQPAHRAAADVDGDLRPPGVRLDPPLQRLRALEGAGRMAHGGGRQAQGERWARAGGGVQRRMHSAGARMPPVAVSRGTRLAPSRLPRIAPRTRQRAAAVQIGADGVAARAAKAPGLPVDLGRVGGVPPAGLWAGTGGRAGSARRDEMAPQVPEEGPGARPPSPHLPANVHTHPPTHPPSNPRTPTCSLSSNTVPLPPKDALLPLDAPAEGLELELLLPSKLCTLGRAARACRGAQGEERGASLRRARLVPHLLASQGCCQAATCAAPTCDTELRAALEPLLLELEEEEEEEEEAQAEEEADERLPLLPLLLAEALAVALPPLPLEAEEKAEEEALPAEAGSGGSCTGQRTLLTGRAGSAAGRRQEPSRPAPTRASRGGGGGGDASVVGGAARGVPEVPVLHHLVRLLVVPDLAGVEGREAGGRTCSSAARERAQRSTYV